MKFIKTDFDGLYEIHLERNGDKRGWFMRTFDLNLFNQSIAEYKFDWKQMNHSFSAKIFTWRGFHFQKEPYQETKLVRCIRGSVLDCVLDLRKSSNTFLNIFQIELSEENNKMLYIPKGFAHGFLTLEKNTELIYLHDEFYRPDYEEGVCFDDIKINLKLPVYPKVISNRDKKHKAL